MSRRRWATGSVVAARRSRSAIVGATLTGALLVSACGSSGQSRTAAATWLGASPAPPSWPVARIASGGALPYPPGWRRTPGDPGTATAVLLDANGRILGYLNLTPRQGDETLANWSSFRIAHNTQEGERSASRLSAATNLAFPTGRGSCVKDSYTTKTGSRYIEIACLVSGHQGLVVIVGAASPSAWPRLGGDISRALAGVRAKRASLRG